MGPTTRSIYLEKNIPLIKMGHLADSFTDFVLCCCLNLYPKENFPRGKKGLEIERLCSRY